MTRNASEIARPDHGADVVAAARMHGLSPAELLDFSSNVNPEGPPPRVRRFLAHAARDSSLLRRYPDDDYTELRSALARRWRVSPEAVAVGNGTSALLHHVVRVIGRGSCLLPEPAFSEYRHALRNSGARIVGFPVRATDSFRMNTHAFVEALARLRPSLAIVNNPHNPSGALIPGPAVASILRAARRAGTTLLLDEAFIDYAGERASQAVVAANGTSLVVLRSLTKIYGMAGMRVGAAVASPSIAGRLRAALPSWPVGVLAAGAALEAMRDVRFAVRSRVRNVRARQSLARHLSRLGCRVFPSAANFLLVRLPEGAPTAGEVRKRLVGEHAILVRDASTFTGLEAGRFLRIAVRRPVENRRLVLALRRVLRGDSQC